MSNCCSKKNWSKIWGETYKLLRIREHQRTQHKYNGVALPCLLLVLFLPKMSWAGKGLGKRIKLCQGCVRGQGLRELCPVVALCWLTWGGRQRKNHQEEPVFIWNSNLFTLLSPGYSALIWIPPVFLRLKEQFLFVIHKSLYELSQSEQKFMISLVLQSLRQIVYLNTVSHIWYTLKNREYFQKGSSAEGYHYSYFIFSFLGSEQ